MTEPTREHALATVRLFVTELLETLAAAPDGVLEHDLYLPYVQNGLSYTNFSRVLAIMVDSGRVEKRANRYHLV